VNFHYALVDDLISREEFEKRVNERMQAAGGLLDENAAALLVVADCGRHHLQIAGIAPGPSVVSFFGKVLSVGEPEEFARRDGETGVRATLLLGDASGRIEVTLWDEKAEAAGEIEPGEVLEVIGKLAPRGGSVTALALRKSTVLIDCPMETERSCASPVGTGDLVVRILGIGEPREFSRRDGTGGTMVTAVIGDGSGTARLVCWDPAVLAASTAGDTVRISGARGAVKASGPEFSLDDRGSVTPACEDVEVRVTPAAEVTAGECVALKGRVAAVRPPRSFKTRTGDQSYVQNIDLADDTGTVHLVLWGDHALLGLSPGDELQVYHARAKEGRDGVTEVSVGRGSMLVGAGEENDEEIVFQGTTVPSSLGMTIDNGTEAYLLPVDILPGQEVTVTGTRRGPRIIPQTIEPANIDRPTLERRLADLLGETS
jgi:replication factor A1